MAAKVVSVWPGCPGFRNIIKEAAEVLRTGGLVAYPTDTLYGLAASMAAPAAVDRLFAVKGRNAEKAVPLLLARDEDLDKVAVDLTPTARRLALQFWPGAFTMVVKRSPVVPDNVTGGGPTVAVRIPHHAVPLALIAELGTPITGTSANRSGGPSPLRASEVMETLGDEIDLLLDAGPCPIGVGSTVVDTTVDPPRVLRQGAVTEAEIRAFLETLQPECHGK